MGTLIEKAPKVFAHHWSCLNGRTSSQVSCFLNGVFLPDCPLLSSHLWDFCAKKAKRCHPPSCCDLLAQWRGSFPSEVGGKTAVTVDDKKRAGEGLPDMDFTQVLCFSRRKKVNGRVQSKNAFDWVLINFSYCWMGIAVNRFRRVWLSVAFSLFTLGKEILFVQNLFWLEKSRRKGLYYLFLSGWSTLKQKAFPITPIDVPNKKTANQLQNAFTFTGVRNWWLSIGATGNSSWKIEGRSVFQLVYPLFMCVSARNETNNSPPRPHPFFQKV